MNTTESKDLEYQIIDLEDHSLSMFEMQGLELGILLTFYVIFALIAITGEAMIVFYIQRYSPKEQSINRMVLIDQVCT